MIQKYERRNWIHRIKVCRQAPSISHMIYADDSYIYCRANKHEAEKIVELLQKFESASGQTVNL